MQILEEDKGKQCSYECCGIIDILPIKCDKCGNIFCHDHYKYINHQCIAQLKINNNINKYVPCPICNLLIDVSFFYCNGDNGIINNKDVNTDTNNVIRIVNSHIDSGCALYLAPHYFQDKNLLSLSSEDNNNKCINKDNNNSNPSSLSVFASIIPSQKTASNKCISNNYNFLNSNYNNTKKSANISSTAHDNRVYFCSYNECNKNELILLLCDKCGNSYCVAHRHPIDHHCTSNNNNFCSNNQGIETINHNIKYLVCDNSNKINNVNNSLSSNSSPKDNKDANNITQINNFQNNFNNKQKEREIIILSPPLTPPPQVFPNNDGNNKLNNNNYDIRTLFPFFKNTIISSYNKLKIEDGVTIAVFVDARFFNKNNNIIFSMPFFITVQKRNVIGRVMDIITKIADINNNNNIGIIPDEKKCFLFVLTYDNVKSYLSGIGNNNNHKNHNNIPFSKNEKKENATKKNNLLTLYYEQLLSPISADSVVENVFKMDNNNEIIHAVFISKGPVLNQCVINQLMEKPLTSEEIVNIDKENIKRKYKSDKKGNSNNVNNKIIIKKNEKDSCLII